MKSNKKIMSIGILIGILILLSSSVLAFAVSSAYWKEYPLEILSGETQEISVTLQNMAGAEDINLKASISESSEITAEIIDSSDIYLVPIGEKTKVNIRITIPKDLEPKRYDLTLSFSTVTEKESGEFGFGSSIEHTLPIEVRGKESAIISAITSSSGYLIIGIIVVIILIVFIKKRKK